MFLEQEELIWESAVNVETSSAKAQSFAVAAGQK